MWAVPCRSKIQEICYDYGYVCVCVIVYVCKVMSCLVCVWSCHVCVCVPKKITKTVHGPCRILPPEAPWLRELRCCAGLVFQPLIQFGQLSGFSLQRSQHRPLSLSFVVSKNGILWKELVTRGHFGAWIPSWIIQSFKSIHSVHTSFGARDFQDAKAPSQKKHPSTSGWFLFHGAMDNNDNCPRVEMIGSLYLWKQPVKDGANSHSV